MSGSLILVAIIAFIIGSEHGKSKCVSTFVEVLKEAAKEGETLQSIIDYLESDEEPDEGSIKGDVKKWYDREEGK